MATRVHDRNGAVAMCDGKQPLTWALAVQIMRREGNRAKKRRPYHCPFCRAWHLGSPMQKFRRPE